MERSVGLNPASMPFLPGAFRGDDAGGNLPGRWHDRASISSLSISPSEYRSARSSPSPPIDNRDTLQGPPNEWSRLSPTVRQIDAVKSHAAIEGRVMKEVSSMGSLDTLHEGDDSQETPVPLSGQDGTQTPGSSSFASQQRRQRSHEFVPTPPTSVIYKSPSVHGDPTSASPVSSLDSGSHFSSAGERQGQSFEEQLKASPIIHDILSRLVQCELFTREIQRDLGEVHRQVNLLVERSLGVHSQPNFKDPFASAKTNGNSFSSPPLNGPRPSMGSIAPNQSIPTDDVTTISQRLNTLTSSVGQLLAIQTQQMQATNADLRSNSIIGLNTIRGDIAPNQVLPHPMMPNSNILGHGLPRPEVGRPARHPGPPMRTWSAGNLELPARPSDNHVGRQENIPRDKRRSVTGLLRRESSGIIETQSDSLGAGSPRDSGPVISKWEQLSLAPDLLRSLSKFGVGPPNKIQQRALPFLLRGSDIIAQAPPTQERIAAYVIPAIQIALTNISVRSQTRGPIVIMISTTVDQATQAQRMIRDLGGPIGVRSALGVGVTSANSELSQELRLLQQNMPHIICGTPQKLHALFTSPGGLVGSEVRFLVLDEVDQLIARNLHEFVFNIVKVLPPPRSRPVGTGTPTPGSTANNLPQIPFNNSQEPSNGIVTPLQSQVRRYSVAPAPSSALNETNINSPLSVERQTALFSNTVPQDVLNLASAIQLREPVRVLVRRDGNVAQTEPSQGSRGLRQFYLYLAFTAGGRSDPMAIPPGGGLGIIGSGRGASSAETAQAREWKLDALADLFDDVEVTQAIVHVGGMTALDSVVYKLASRGLEAVPLHGDMNAGTKLAALNKFRNSNNVIIRPPPTKVLVVYDVQVKAPDVSHVPLVINYDLPKAVEEYAHRVAPAVASNYARAGVVVNFVTATGGDVEMLRSIECFYKIKCPEVPMTLRDVV